MTNLALFLSLLLSQIAFGQSSTEYFRDQTSGLPSASGFEHAFCYMSEGDQKIQGENTQGLVKIASVSKLATSYWALKKLGPDYRYRTKLYYQPQSGKLHIEGSRDPIFGRNRMYLLLSELNQLGITHLKEVSFDSEFKVFINVEDAIRSSLGVRGGVSTDNTKENLELFMNTSRWETFARYQTAKTEAHTRGVDMLSEFSMQADLVYHSDNIPFSPQSSQIYEFASIPLFEMLKLVNVESHNYIADEIYNGLGGAEKFARFIQNDLDFDNKDIQMFTGSGLPLETETSRKDNMATCSAIIEITEAMSELLESFRNRDLDEVMLVTGEDAGTMKRFTEDIYDGTMVAKTGTINYAITLAGQFQGEDGRMYYGIYLQVPSSTFWASAWAIRDRLIERFISLNGSGKKYDYQKRREFFPIDRESLLVQVQDKLP